MKEEREGSVAETGCGCGENTSVYVLPKRYLGAESHFFGCICYLKFVFPALGSGQTEIIAPLKEHER